MRTIGITSLRHKPGLDSAARLALADQKTMVFDTADKIDVPVGRGA